jgi:U-box domain
MKREMKKGSPDIKLFSEMHSIITSHPTGDLQSETSNLSDKNELREIILPVLEIHDVSGSGVERIMQDLLNKLKRMSMTNLTIEEKSNPDVNTESMKKTQEKIKKGDAITIPEDFRCPISLELMRDPVIVSTGQVCKCDSNT